MNEQERNRRLRATLDSGQSPLDDGVIRTMRRMAEANLDIPGPRVLQLLARLDELSKT